MLSMDSGFRRNDGYFALISASKVSTSFAAGMGRVRATPVLHHS